MAGNEFSGSIECQFDINSMPLLFEHFFPIVWIYAVDGEHADTIEILPGIFIEEEPLWHWWARKMKPVVW
jgi:hypothetical protein